MNGSKFDLLTLWSGPLSATYFHKRSHKSSRKIKVGDIWHQTGIIMVHVRGTLSPHVRRLPIKSMWRRPKIRVLWPTPRRMLTDSRMRQSVSRVVMRRSNFYTRWGGKETLISIYSKKQEGEGADRRSPGHIH